MRHVLPFYWTRVRSLFTLVTHSFTHSVTLVNTIDVTLTCEYAYSKLGDVVTIADVDSEKRVDESLVQIWKLTFGPESDHCLPLSLTD